MLPSSIVFFHEDSVGVSQPLGILDIVAVVMGLGAVVLQHVCADSTPAPTWACCRLLKSDRALRATIGGRQPAARI